MFISEREAQERINSPENVLTRIDRAVEDAPDVGEAESPITPDALDFLDDILGVPTLDAGSTEPDVFAQLQLEKLLSPHKPGRKPNIRNRTTEENASVALLGQVLGRKTAEEMVGVDPIHQSHLVRGYTSPVDRLNPLKGPKEELLDEIARQGKTVANKAFQKLNLALDAMTPAKISAMESPVKIAQVARGMSSVIKDITPKDANLDEGGVHFHIYAPPRVSEDHYSTVEVGKDGSVSVAGPGSESGL